MTQFISSISPMPHGFAGQVTRGFFDNTVETKEATTAIGAGLAVKLDTTGKVAKVSAAADAVYGFVVREFGQAGSAEEQSLVAVLRRGYLAIKVTGAPAVGGKVYLTSSGELTATAASNTAVPGATFCGTADASGIVEIAFNI